MYDEDEFIIGGDAVFFWEERHSGLVEEGELIQFKVSKGADYGVDFF